MTELTPEGRFVLSAIVLILLCIPLWIFWTARRNDGVAELPSWVMFGWLGAAWGRTCIVIDRDAWSKDALIAHERCHQQQMRRDGTLAFYWRYFTSRSDRQRYEIEAYRVWVSIAPDDIWRCANALVNEYGLDMAFDDVAARLIASEGDGGNG